MPHSTGGGGSHSGSSSSGGSRGGSGGGSSIHYYNHYHPGLHVWVRYINGVPHYRYVDASCREGVSFFSYLPVLILAVFIGVLALSSGAAPARVTSGEAPLVIEDDAGIFTQDEEDKLESAVGRYYDETGIPVVIQTIDFDSWNEEYGSWGQDQAEYAYDSYLDMFPADEKHWLVCVWDGEENADTGEVDSDAYTFEGVAGDDTSKMLPDSMTRVFNSTVSRQLGENLHRDGACADALAAGFDSIGAPKTNILFVSIGLGCLALGAFTMVLYALAVRKDKRTPLARKEHEVNTHGEAPRLVHCDYCGGTYVFGEIACPHCNAPGKTVCDGSAGQGTANA